MRAERKRREEKKKKGELWTTFPLQDGSTWLPHLGHTSIQCLHMQPTFAPRYLPSSLVCTCSATGKPAPHLVLGTVARRVHVGRSTLFTCEITSSIPLPHCDSHWLACARRDSGASGVCMSSSYESLSHARSTLILVRRRTGQGWRGGRRGKIQATTPKLSGGCPRLLCSWPCVCQARFLSLTHRSYLALSFCLQPPHPPIAAVPKHLHISFVPSYQSQFILCSDIVPCPPRPMYSNTWSKKVLQDVSSIINPFPRLDPPVQVGSCHVLSRPGPVLCPKGR